jgi:hypothetical protein
MPRFDAATKIAPNAAWNWLVSFEMSKLRLQDTYVLPRLMIPESDLRARFKITRVSAVRTMPWYRGLPLSEVKIP